MALKRARPWATVILTVLVCAASVWLERTAHGLYCERLPEAGVLAMLATVVAVLCLRQMSFATQRWLLAVCLVLALAAVVLDVRFVMQYRDLCNGLRRPAPTAAPRA